MKKHLVFITLFFAASSATTQANDKGNPWALSDLASRNTWEKTASIGFTTGSTAMVVSAKGLSNDNLLLGGCLCCIALFSNVTAGTALHCAREKKQKTD